MLVNIPLFTLPGQVVMNYLTYRGSTLAHYVERMFSIDGLKRLIGGKVDLMNIIRGQLARPAYGPRPRSRTWRQRSAWPTG